MTEFDINNIAALERRLAELKAAAGAQTQIATDGGSYIGGDVKTAGGHVIGRDFIQIVVQCLARGEDAAAAQSALARHLAGLGRQLAGLPLGEIDVTGIDTARQQALELADVYVPLNTTLSIPADATLEQFLAARTQAKDGAGMAPKETRPVAALEALAVHRRLTLLGGAGSGKSTFGNRVLLALIQAWQGDAAALHALGDTWNHGPLLPLRIVLRDFAEGLPAKKANVCADDLWQFVAREFQKAGFGQAEDVLRPMQRIAFDHGAFVVFDGLDECGDAAKQARVLQAVTKFIDNAGPNCRFLLTARPYAWTGKADPAQGVYHLADLDDSQVEAFIRTWYQAVVRRGWYGEDAAAHKCANLLEARNRPDLRPLAANPLLLTLTASLHANSAGGLPDDRADLYHESVELLLRRWNCRIGADQALLTQLNVDGLKLADLRAVLERLAYGIHAANIREGAADIAEHGLLDAFRDLLGGSRDKAAIVVEYIERRAGLLIGRGPKDGERKFGFPHRSFQEFLAACHLAKTADFATTCAKLARQAPGHWQEVLPLAARLAGAERGAAAADGLVASRNVADFGTLHGRAPDPAEWTCAWLAGLQLKEIGPRAVAACPCGQAIGERVKDWLRASLPVHPDAGGAPAAQRARAGDVLARLGDPRFDPARFHLLGDANLGFVAIAADPAFMIGTRKADRGRIREMPGYPVDVELNDKTTPTQAFHIARYPVTVAQFRAYCEARRIRPGDENALRDTDNRPVRRVSWHEARAYCEWLHETFAASSILACHPIARLVREKDWRIALPSELEWEKAARGTRVGALFPWGDEADPERANYTDTEIGDTTAVGCFPANDLGLHDMVGNVWEWTRSLWGSNWDKPQFGYPYDAGELQRENLDAPDKMLRVVRGGSWGNHLGLARCAFRLRAPPGDRYDRLGFRVVLRSSPVS